MHPQVFINPQRIQRRGIKTRQKHIHHDQQINLSILHPQTHVFIVILETLGASVVICAKSCIIVLDYTLEKVTRRDIKPVSILRVLVIHAVHFQIRIIRSVAINCSNLQAFNFRKLSLLALKLIVIKLRRVNRAHCKN